MRYVFWNDNGRCTFYSSTIGRELAVSLVDFTALKLVCFLTLLINIAKKAGVKKAIIFLF